MKTDMEALTPGTAEHSDAETMVMQIQAEMQKLQVQAQEIAKKNTEYAAIVAEKEA